jgi:rubrerythrin
MTTTTVEPTQLSQFLPRIYQYTAEAYKTFQKFAENLPNPMTATMFKQFAIDEREVRDLIDIKSATLPGVNVRATLGGDLGFQDMLEGELSYRESAEFLIARERTLQKKLREIINSSDALDRNLMIYIESVKKSHAVELERELELIKLDSDWWKREDAQWRIVHGSASK